MTKSLTPSGGTIHVLQSKPWLKSISSIVPLPTSRGTDNVFKSRDVTSNSITSGELFLFPLHELLINYINSHNDHHFIVTRYGILKDNMNSDL